MNLFGPSLLACSLTPSPSTATTTTRAALGTLYAYSNASKIARETYGIDLDAGLQSGKLSAALYHTAGKGTRLAPLPGAENNNKPGVKLPATVEIAGSLSSITILEAVVMQTGCYAKSRPGRLSVFWGDQIFVPTVDVGYTVTHHVDILCSLGPMMSEDEWKSKGMDKYGLIAVGDKGEAAQVEKVSHSTAVGLLAHLGEISAVGVSLGSFSVSSPMLFALLSEFSGELAAKSGKLDSDPHLWMPMTLDRSAYLQLMSQKGVTEDVSAQHFDRIADMMKRFNSSAQSGAAGALGLFGPVDVGQGVNWWDYGQLKLYQRNTLLMAHDSTEAQLIRSFYGIAESDRSRQSSITNTAVDGHSTVSGCELGFSSGAGGGGSVKSSVLSNVKCKHIDADGCVLINVTAKRIVAKPGSIVYNVIDSSEEGIVVGPGDVLAGVSAPDGSQQVIRSHMDIDGGKSWETRVAGNPMSFEQVYDSNTEVCPITIEKTNAEAHRVAWQAL